MGKTIVKLMRGAIRRLLGRTYRKHGVTGTIILVGDAFVGFTKSKEDDKQWEAIKKNIEADLSKAKTKKSK